MANIPCIKRGSGGGGDIPPLTLSNYSFNGGSTGGTALNFKVDTTKYKKVTFTNIACYSNGDPYRYSQFSFNGVLLCTRGTAAASTGGTSTVATLVIDISTIDLCTISFYIANVDTSISVGKIVFE